MGQRYRARRQSDPSRQGRKMRRRPCACKLTGLAFAILSSPAFAGSGSEIGAVSAQTVKISVSVAPQYKLMIAPSIGPADMALDPARFCLKTNALAPAMPIMVVFAGLDTAASAPKRAAGAPPSVIVACASASKKLEPSLLDADTNARIVLVRPE